MKSKGNFSRASLAGMIAALLLLPARPTCGGAVEFLRDELGLPTTNLVFGAPPSAFSGLQRQHHTANSEVWGMELPGSRPGTFTEGNRRVSFTFVSNRLEAVEVSNGGKARNDQLVTAFRLLLPRPEAPLARYDDYTYKDGAYRLSYRGLCSSVENMVAIFRLSTEAGERRIQEAAAAQATGPAVFVVRFAHSLMAGTRPAAANMLLERNSGPASDLTFQAPAGMKVQVQRPTGFLDHYNLLFRPDGESPFMPETWRFHALFNDVTGKRQERLFQVAPSRESKIPPALEVTEVRE